jgi:hypothetical protein
MLPTISLIFLLIASLAQGNQVKKAQVISTMPPLVVTVGDSNQSITVDGLARWITK